jgi:hypothetical protein
MANEIKWKAPTSRTSGISSASLNAGTNLLGSEIDNETNLDRWMALNLTWTCSSAATAGKVIEAYVIYDVTSSAYEDGGTSEDPVKAPVAVFVDDGGTGAQQQTVEDIPIKPFAFKILLKSELDQNATSVTLLAETYNEEVQ